jgi:putative zinc finger protein
VTPSCESLERLSLGAYVLGALDPVERAAVDAHLSECASCRDELAGLAAMPGLLSRVRVEDVLEPNPSPSRATADRLIGRLRAARRARRRRLGAAAGAVAVAAIAAAAAIVISTNDTGSSGTSNVASISATNARTGVSASFGVRPAPWGTAVEVRLRGVPPNTHCKLIVRGRGGEREVAGTWRATYDGTANLQTATAIPRSRITAIEVATTTGHRLVRAVL